MFVKIENIVLSEVWKMLIIDVFYFVDFKLLKDLSGMMNMLWKFNGVLDEYLVWLRV